MLEDLIENTFERWFATLLVLIILLAQAQYLRSVEFKSIVAEEFAQLLHAQFTITLLVSLR